MAFSTEAKTSESFDTEAKPKHGSVAKFGFARFGQARFGQIDVSWTEEAKQAEAFNTEAKPT